MEALKDIVQVLATTALLWAGRHPNQLLPSPTPTQPLLVSIPTVTVYPPSRCLSLPSYPSMPGASPADGRVLIQTLVFFVAGLFIFGFFSLALGLSLHGTQHSSHLQTTPSSEATPTVDHAIERVAEARTQPEEDNCQTTQELLAKIQNLEGQIMDKATEITSLKLHHERQLASIRSDFEGEKSQWAAAQRALEVEGQDMVADLRAKIAQLEQQVESHNATVEQLTAGRQTELETLRSNHRSALQDIQGLSVKIQDLDGQITIKAAEIKSLEYDHECQLASTRSDFEIQKSHWEAAHTALKVGGETTVADLRAKIAQLEEQANSHIATVERITTSHQAELETERSHHRSALNDLTSTHETTTTSLTNDLVKTQARATQLETDLNRALKENGLLESSKRVWEELESSRSTIISEIKAKLEEASKQLEDADQEEASTQDRLAAAEAEEAAVEQVVLQSARPEPPESSRNSTDESESVEPPLPEQGLSASMWATSRSAVEHEPPSRPDWGAEAARRAHNGNKSHQKGAQRSKGGQRHPGGGSATASWSTAERIASGKAGPVKITKNSHKDVRYLSKESEYKYN